jgi:hypothetical protein
MEEALGFNLLLRMKEGFKLKESKNHIEVVLSTNTSTIRSSNPMICVILFL